MVKKRETIEILKREYDYEDEIMKNLTEFFLASLNKIKNLSDKERTELQKKLSQIRDESRGHKQAFGELIEFVEKDGANNY
jgi:predicted  nucleic acid-binding Zn-ribbon protein